MPLKVLILCKSFPPSNNIGGKRPYAWHKYLINFGVETTVITATLSPATEIEKDIYRVDCGTELLDDTLEISKLALLKRKFRSFFDIWLPFFWPAASRYYPIFLKTNSLMKKMEFDVIIATGNPFILFKFAALLSNRFNTPYILDYRDNWSTQPNVENNTLRSAVHHKLFRKIEKRLLKNAYYVLTVGEATAVNINHLEPTQEIHIIPNGHDIPMNFNNSNPSDTFLRITYIGRLYKHKNPIPFLEALSTWLS